MSFDSDLLMYIEKYKVFLRANGGRPPFKIESFPLFHDRCRLLGNTPAGDKLNQLWRAEREAEEAVKAETQSSHSSTEF